jgi:hypothetical protein
MEKVQFWTIPVGTVFIEDSWLYKKVGETSAIGYGQLESKTIYPHTEITPIVKEDFIVMRAIPLEETL